MSFVCAFSFLVLCVQCAAAVEVGGEVDSLLLGGGYLFVGLHKGGEGIIKVWNMATGANHLLTGHKVRGQATHTHTHTHSHMGLEA